MWKRSTVNSDRSFTVDHPYFLAAGALHVEDVLDLFVGNDPLGIRGRLGLFYARATFKKAREVREAAESLTTQRRGGNASCCFVLPSHLLCWLRWGLHGLLRQCFDSCWKAHDPVHGASPAFFQNFRGGQ